MTRRARSAEPRVPADLRKALSATPMAKTQWRDLTPIARRDFIIWMDSAKQPEAHKRRIEKACSRKGKPMKVRIPGSSDVAQSSVDDGIRSPN